jgi:Flp pilus assembly pilin Flp
VKGFVFMFTGLVEMFRSKILKSENGQDLAEYSLLLGLIALLVIVSLTIIGTSFSDIFTLLANAIDAGL